MANETKSTAVEAVGGFFKAVGGFFSGFGTAVVKGDIFVKLSLLWWGAGYVRRKQFVKALIMTALEAAVILFTIFFASRYVPKFGTLGTVKAEMVFNIDTMKNEFNDYDHSFYDFVIFTFQFCCVVCCNNCMDEEYGKRLQTPAYGGKRGTYQYI